MTRYTNLSRKRTYVQAGFAHPNPSETGLPSETDGQNNLYPADSPGETHGSSHLEPVKKKWRKHAQDVGAESKINVDLDTKEAEGTGDGTLIRTAHNAAKI